MTIINTRYMLKEQEKKYKRYNYLLNKKKLNEKQKEELEDFQKEIADLQSKKLFVGISGIPMWI